MVLLVAAGGCLALALRWAAAAEAASNKLPGPGCRG
jgi:hypothetical protein